MNYGIDFIRNQGINNMYIGIDVSDNNGVLDWDSIKASGKLFAMVRVGYGSNFESQDDKQAIRNMQECERIGMPYGAYIYGYALNADEATSEADHAIRMTKDHNPIMGIYIDMEDADGYKKRNGLIPEENGELLTDFCIIFMNKIRTVGYGTGIYANMNYFKNILSLERFATYPKWLAIWGPDTCPEGDWTIWQFSSDGSVPGSSARTDVNYYMKELPTASVIEVGQEVVEPIEERPIEVPSTAWKEGDHVDYNKIYYESGAWQAMDPTYTDGVITHVYIGSRNPYLIDNGTGFLNDECITGCHIDGTPSVTDTTAASTEIDYVIQPGDCLGNIANKYGVDCAFLAQYNNVADANMIVAGNTLRIPGVEVQAEVAQPESNEEEATATVLPGEGFWQVAGRMLGNSNRYIELAQYNGMDINTMLRAGMVLRLPQ